MNKDEEILKLMTSIAFNSYDFVEYVSECGDQSEYTDRMVEIVIELSQKLKEKYNKEYMNEFEI